MITDISKNLFNREANPIPRVQDCLDTVSGAKFFGTIDLTAGYNQVSVRTQDIPKTAFACKLGLFEYIRMPFGLSGAPSTFQRLMELALAGLTWRSCIVYLDDVICYAKSFPEFILRMREILERMRSANFRLKPRKCHLIKSEVEFLGHVVSGEGVKPKADNVAKILGWKRPTDALCVRQFVGTVSYYRRFIPMFAKIAKPLTDLYKHDTEFIWTLECQEAFDKLKQALTGSNIMAYPRDNGLFILDTDACRDSIGCVLSQVQEGQEKVIAYASRSLNKNEMNWCITDRELLAVRYYMEYYRQYLLGRHFLVRTDHQALKWLFSFKEPKGRIARWLEIMSQYDFELEFRAGKSHGNADGLSRCPNPRDCTCNEVDTLEEMQCHPCSKCRKRAIDMCSSWNLHTQCETETIRAVRHDTAKNSIDDVLVSVLSKYTLNQLKEMQEKDDDIGPFMQWLKGGDRPYGTVVAASSPGTRHYWNYWSSMLMKDGLLFKKFYKNNDTGYYYQLVVPRDMRKEILFQMHNSLLSGHLGRKKTLDKIRQRFYWFGLAEDVTVWLASCDSCGANKSPAKTPRAPLGDMRVGFPWDRLCTDFFGPLPETPRGNRFILVVTDHFSRWVELLPVPDQTAVTCARTLLNEVISRYGSPLGMHSDQGKAYESKVFAELCKLLEIKKTRASPRNPKCNGMPERFNKTMIRMIRAYLKGQQTDWDLYLGCLAGAYRATTNATSRLTPNLVVLGREVRIPAEIVHGTGISPLGTEVQSYGEYVSMLRDRMAKAHTVVRKNLGEAAQRQKDHYDSKKVVNTYNAGDLAWYMHELRYEGVSPKLQTPYVGPVLILKRMGEVNYVIQITKDSAPKNVHHNKLKPYCGNTKLPWSKNALKRFQDNQ